MTKVHGQTVDDHTRCVHYRTPLDIVALKFKCCGRYYPCYECHSAESDHGSARWSRAELARGAKVVLCGECKAELTFAQYEPSRCPRCGAGFNPRCSLHYDLYFEPDQ